MVIVQYHGITNLLPSLYNGNTTVLFFLRNVILNFWLGIYTLYFHVLWGLSIDKDNYTVQTVNIPTLTLPLDLPIIEHFNFQKTHHLVWFISCFPHGDQKMDFANFVGTFCPHNVQ